MGVASHGINGGQMEFFHNNWWYISIVEMKKQQLREKIPQVPLWTFSIGYMNNSFFMELMSNKQ